MRALLARLYCTSALASDSVDSATSQAFVEVLGSTITASAEHGIIERTATMKLAFILALQTMALYAAADLPTAKPESVGFSSDRLQNLHSLIQNEIDQKELAGAITILGRHGKIIDYRTYGQRDMEKSVSMTKDTIFRAYSMTKPLTGVAMMILYEQGKWL